MKYLKWTLTTILALTLLAAAGSWLWLRSKKPAVNTELRLPGLQKPVEILFDEHGIPHIYAANEQDAYCALGYVHARDRLFQMEMLRRLADGRLSEIIGEKTVDVDRFFRTLSIREHARHTLAEVYANPNDPMVLAANAYYRGVNHFLETGPAPPEFDMLGIPKRPFSLEDGLVVGGYMGFSFTDAFDTEAINELILQKLGPQYLADLPNEWDSAAVKIPVQAPNRLSGAGAPADAGLLLSLSAKVRDIQTFCRALPPFLGSNGWVLGPGRTKNGKVILENDTHIGFSQPSVWYEAQLSYGDYSLYGNFIAGAPLPVLGHTKDVAWGLTMFENDDVDFYRETVNPDNPNQVRFRDAWEDMEIREEIIKVKDGEEQRLPVRKTRHGYLVNGIARPFKTDTQALAMWWIYRQRPDRGPLAFYRLAHARNVADAEQAVALMHAPGLNVMFGDASGNIAWWAAGSLPRRPAHVRPWLVLDGASGRDEIEGWLPFSENPHNVNPPEGFVYSANNQPERTENQPLTPGYYVPEDRARRISQWLSGDKKDWTSDEVRQMTLDTRNPVFPVIAQQMLAALSLQTEPERKAAAILKNWPGSHDLTDVAPTVFYRWLYHFYRNTFGDELGDEGLKMLHAAHLGKRLLEPVARNEHSVWWDDVSTTGKRETRAEIFDKSFRQAVADLVAQLGPDPATWQWQRVHTLEHKHPLGILPAVGPWFNVGPFPCPGGRETINNLDFPLDSTGLYRVAYGPALRRVFDFSAPEQAMSINPTGQSGLVNSPFYADQAQMFVAGEFRHEWTRRAEVERVKSSRLALRP